MKSASSSHSFATVTPGSCVKVFISAGEASSDLHGAQFLEALAQKMPEGQRLEAFGVGGPRLKAAGLRAIVDTRELMTMGFWEVLIRLPQVFRILNRVSQAVASDPPDVAVVLDYPGFHFRLVKKLRRLQIPWVYYIPPKVWVWRESRVRFLKRFFKKILVIFPFEEAFYRKFQVDAKYVGNPLLDELPMNLTRLDARKKLGLQPSDRVLLLMPGSRESEWDQHFEVLLGAAWRACASLRQAQVLSTDERLKVLIPVPEQGDLARVQQRLSRWQAQCGDEAGIQAAVDWRVSQGTSAWCMGAADAGLIKSGTSTLEAALLGLPMVVVYRVSRLSQWFFQSVVRYRGAVGLVNLVVGPIVPEVLGAQVKVESLSQWVVRLMTDQQWVAQMRARYDELRREMIQGPAHPSQMVAQEVLAVVEEKKRGERPNPSGGAR
ncbi:MAG: lipid-A-disaccharide synthase [Bdellovibrionia bacterium]